MLAEIWNTILYHPLINALIWFNHLTGNLGWAIISLTVALRVIMTPLVIPSLKTSKKMSELAPELAKLKEKFKDDKQGLLLAQSQLYKQHGVSPTAGCLPQIVQLVVLIALFNALNLVIKAQNPSEALNPLLYAGNKLDPNISLSTHFAYLDLVKPDVFKIPGLPFPLPGIFLIGSAIVQFVSSKMMSPVVAAEKKVSEKTSESTDDAMVAAQQQMLYLFPLMTLIIGLNFPSGLVLYWLFFSGVSILQQYLISGWGGMAPLLKRLNLVKSA